MLNNPDRRQALGLGGAFLGTASMGPLAARAAADGGDPVARAFAAARRTRAWTLGFEAPARRDLDTATLHRLSGALPPGLDGVFYRNGPALFERAGYRYRHWFDGDGMVHRYRFGEGAVSHRGRLVATRKLAEEDVAGRFIRSEFGSDPDAAAGSSGPDDSNAANTSVLPLGDAVLALWEAGSAYELDGASLATRGPKTWRADLAGLPFSAHPKRTPGGVIYNFGADPGASRVVLWRIGAGGELEDARLTTLPRVGLMHDFAITSRHLVFLANSYRTTKMTRPFLDSFTPDAALPVLIMAVPLGGGRTQTWELPPGFVFHIGNAFEDEAGVIRLDAAWYDDLDWPKDGAEALMRGAPAAPRPSRMALITLAPGRPSGALSLTDGGEFPVVDPRRVGLRHDVVFHLTEGRAAAPARSAVARRNWRTGEVSSFDYGPDRWAEEHVFAPSGSREGQGWLIGTVLNLAAHRTEVHVLDAEHPADGPVASFALPYPVPLGFHGAWRAA